MTSTESANTPVKEQAFFAEEASKQILVRVASVLQDPDICDATFLVDDGTDTEEICAPSQIMAMSSPYFKTMFYPASGKHQKINGMQPKTFRKILDYLFRGRVPLSSIEDAWKVKVAGRTFQLKELEELCTKFLQYRIDSRNLIHFLKNTIKYDTPDLRDIVITRFLQNADKGFEDPQILDLSEEELLNIMKRRPEVQARKVMEVLIKWAKKRFAIEAPKEELPLEEKKEETKKEDVKDDTKKEEKKAEGGDSDVEMVEEKKDDTKKEEEKKDETKKEEEKKDDTKKEEEKKEDTKMEEDKKEDTKKEDSKVEDVKVEEKPVVEVDLILALQHFVKYLQWDHTDAPYYLNEVRGKLILSEEDQNGAMTDMLQSFVDYTGKQQQMQQQTAAKAKLQQEQIVAQQAAAAKMSGPKSAQQRGRPVQRR